MQFLRSLVSRAASVRWPVFGQADRPLGVDVGASAVKLVDLSPLRRDGLPRWQLEGAEVLPWTAPVVDPDGTVRDLQAAVQRLKPLVDAAGWRGRSAVAAMPGGGVTVQHLQVPTGLSERDLELEVQMQLEPLLPMPLAQACVDFVSESDGRVRAVAALRAAVDSRRMLLELAGLQVVAMDLAPDALRRAAGRASRALQGAGSANRHPGVTALIDIGAQSARIQILWGTQVLHEREQPGLGAQPLASMSLTDAAQALSGALSLFFDGRVQGLQDILLSGAAAMRAGLASAMQAHNLCNCEVLLPFAGMRLSDRLDRTWLGTHGAALSVACGLALRSEAADSQPRDPVPAETTATGGENP